MSAKQKSTTRKSNSKSSETYSTSVAPNASQGSRKATKSEAEIVRSYANRVIKNQQYHGRIADKFKGLKQERSVSKNLWMDDDFFFSVVFQSSEQKYEFLKQLGVEVDKEGTIQIVNGLKLADKLNIALKLETTKDYPTGSIDLKPFVLDTETLDSSKERQVKANGY